MRNLTDYTSNYIDQPFENIQVGYRKKMVLELLKNQRHKNILEVGCGLDPFFNHYNDFEKIVIIEPSTIFYNNAGNAIRNNQDLTSRVTLINDYLENSINELSKYEFDYIIISCLLHEIENVSLFFEKLRHLLKKETIVHIDVPNAYSFHRVLAFEMGLIDSVFDMSATNLQFQQQRVCDLKSLSKLIIEQDFEIIGSGSYFLKPFTHKQMSELIKHKIIDKNVLDGFYKMTKYIPDMGSEIYVNFKLKN
jgi:SAM-dependent methyltransferase